MRNSFPQFIRCSFVGLALAGSVAIAADSSVTTASDPKDMKELKPNLAAKPETASPFQFDIGLPVWSCALDGTVGIKGVQGAIKVPFSSIWDHMDYVVPLAMDARYGKWGFHIDGQYVKLSENFATRGILFTSGTLKMEQAFANFNLNYRVLDTERWQVTPYIGGRYNYLSLKGTLTSRFPGVIPDQDQTGSTSWVDPLLGTNVKLHVYKPLSLLALAEVGGFGVNSHLTYQFYGGGEVQITRNLYAELGYRYLYTDYASGGFTYDVAMSGPEITFGARF